MYRLKPVLFSLLFLTATAFPQAPAAPVPPTKPLIPKPAPLNRSIPTLFIVGDSTARKGPAYGWGDHLGHYFDLARINVANRAQGGRSSRTFISEGFWDSLLSEMKPGDFVLIQIGQNDAGDLTGPKARASLKGIGNEEQQITLPDGREELVHTYGWYIRHYIHDTRGVQATPILLSLTIRNVWRPGSDGTPRIERDLGYDAELAAIAKEQDVAFVDMATVEADSLEALGREKTAAFYPSDPVHTTSEGAELNAEYVVTALRNAHSPLVAYLKPTSSSK